MNCLPFGIFLNSLLQTSCTVCKLEFEVLNKKSEPEIGEMIIKKKLCFFFTLLIVIGLTDMFY